MHEPRAARVIVSLVSRSAHRFARRRGGSRVSAASPRARRSSSSLPTSSGRRHSCQASLTMTTGARSHAPRHSTSISVKVPLASVSPGLMPSVAAQLLGDPLGAVQRARQRPADAQHEPADRLGVEHRVVRHDVLDVGGGDPEQSGDVAHRVGGDVALLVLHQVERRQHRRPLAVGRIARDDLVEAGAVFRACRRTARPVRRRACAPTCGRWRRTPSSDESSPVHVSHHDVDRSDHGDDVGNQPADDHLLERLAGEQRRRARLDRHGRLVPSETT